MLGPFAGAWLNGRANRGKEDAARLHERAGEYVQLRPTGRVMWLHAASVGESGVALALIEALVAQDAALSFVLSTGTKTSAELVARRAPARTTHVYAPLDRAGAVRRFYEHWRPDAGVFVESELWPNLILEGQARGVPLALVNARMSPKTLARWRRWRTAGARLTGAFAWISAADARTAAALSEVAGRPVANLGNLKLAAAPSVGDGTTQAALAEEIAGRRVWLAASTHEGEDEIVLAAHAELRKAEPNALLIIAPRHPERGAQVAALAGGAPRRSRFDKIGAAPVYVADTLGELGMLYQLAPVALVAGSLLPELKGHNPIEPAKLGAAILTGPYVESFDDVFAQLAAARGVTIVARAEAISQEVARLWRDEALRTELTSAARAVADQGAQGFAATVDGLIALLPQRAATPEAANASA